MSYYVDNSGKIIIIPDQPTSEDIENVVDYLNKEAEIEELKEVPINFKYIAESCQESENWEIIGKAGKGAVGSVYHVCRDTNDCKYTMKVQDISSEKNDMEFRNEVTILEKLQGWRGAPVLYAAWTCEDKGYYIMEILDELDECSIPKDKIWANATHLLDELHELGYIHGDTHSGNVMCRKDGTLVFVDYGSAVHFPDRDAVLTDNRIHIEGRKMKQIPGKGFVEVGPYSMYELAKIDRWKLSTLKDAPESEEENAYKEYNKMRKFGYEHMRGPPSRVLTGHVDKAISYDAVPTAIPSREDLVEKERNRVLEEEREAEDRKQRFIKAGQLYHGHPYFGTPKIKLQKILEKNGLSTEGNSYQMAERLLEHGIYPERKTKQKQYPKPEM